MSTLTVAYDSEVDAAYLSLGPIGDGEITNTYSCPDLESAGEINLDFDSDGRLRGIEILDASKVLPQHLLGE